jgi:hypothetical protein
MNNIKFIVLLLTICTLNHAPAQEAELQLDSIVIIDNALSINKVPSRSYDYEGYDTVNLNLNSSQVVKLRYAGMTVTRSSNSFGSTIDLDGNSQILNLLIRSSSGHNFLDGNRISRNASRGLVSSGSWLFYVDSKSTTFNSHPNQLISPSENIIIEYVQEIYSRSYTIRYRLELLYYSID